MTNFFRELPIKRKLIVVVMLATGAALLLSCAALFVHEFYMSRKGLERDMASLAGVLGANSTAALSFNDRAAAAEILSALQAEPQIVAARIYKKDGTPFADYIRSAHAKFPAKPGPDGCRQSGGYLTRFGPIFDQKESGRIGTIYLESDFHEMRERIAGYVGLLALVFVASAMVAFALSTQLQRIVSTPILNLANATRRISRDRDYAIRVPAASGDELGELIGGFNEMLAQIQLRDAALQRAHDDLEHRVQDRTRELEQEVAERKRAEGSLARSLSLVNGTLESTADGILVVSNEKRIVRFNRKFLQMWGIADVVVAPGDELKVFAPALDQIMDREAFVTRVRGLLADSNSEGFDMVEFKDGRVFEHYSQPQRVEGVCIGRVWSFRDVTESHRAGERLRQQASLLDLAQDSILVRDLDDRVIFANKSAERACGWRVEEMAGKSVRELIYRDTAKFDEAKRILMLDGQWSGEVVQRARNGGERTVESRWTLMHDEHGVPTSVLVINTDITDRKKLESQFLRAQRMECIGHLAAGIAHDLNNILTPIVMSVDLIRKNGVSGAASDLLDAIANSAHRGSDLVRQVLNFGRGLEGQHTILQSRHVLGEVMKIVGDTFPKSITARSSAPRDLWLVKADATQLHQVLLNLCVNARDAMPDGGVLKVTAANVTLDEKFVALHPDAKVRPYVLFTVADTGTGIPADIREKIFDPFFTTKEIGKGSGLGLATAIVIIKSHGGFLNLESEVGRGTTFQIYLPAEVDAKLAETAKETLPPQGSGELVLIVDDEMPVRRIAERTLKAAGYRVITACDGSEGVKIYTEHQKQISAVFTDMMMPVMDGAAMIRAMKQINPQVNIIAASGLVEGQMIKAEQAGARMMLRKPFTSGEVLRAVRKVMDEVPV